MKLGNNIKKFREQRGFSQNELANYLSVTPQSVSRWENGLTYPDIEKLPKIAMLFDTTIDELMGVQNQTFYGISNKLSKLRKQANDSTANAEIQLEYLELLEKTVEQGIDVFLVEYQNCVRKLFEKELIDFERYNNAGNIIRNTLYSLPPIKRINKLRAILINEPDERLPLWIDFATDDNLSSWLDLLHMRAYVKGNIDDWKSLRAEILYNDIAKSVYNITQRSAVGDIRKHELGNEPLENLKLAEQLINCFSTRKDDLFILLRITLLIRFIFTYLVNGMHEEMKDCISELKVLLDTANSLLDKELSGSVEVFSDYTITMSRIKYENCLFEIELLINEFEEQELNDICSDMRAYIKSLLCRLDPFYYIDEKDIDEFKELYGVVEKRSAKLKPKYLSYVIAVKTSRKIIYEAVLNCECEDKMRQSFDKFIERLRVLNDNHIEYIVGNLCDYSQRFCLEMPSMDVRRWLCEFDKSNLEAKMLLQGRCGYVSRSIKDTLGPISKLQFE